MFRSRFGKNPRRVIAISKAVSKRFREHAFQARGNIDRGATHVDSASNKMPQHREYACAIHRRCNRYSNKSGFDNVRIIPPSLVGLLLSRVSVERWPSPRRKG